jgi:hypothetical protein
VKLKIGVCRKIFCKKDSMEYTPCYLLILRSEKMMHYWKNIFLQNWKSGLTVAVINIPLSIALAVSSG